MVRERRENEIEGTYGKIAAEGYEVLKSSVDMSILREKQPQERQMWKETEDEEVF